MFYLKFIQNSAISTNIFAVPLSMHTLIDCSVSTHVFIVVVVVESHPRIALSYFTLKALLLYPPHKIVMSNNSYVVILISETADLLGLWLLLM